MSGQERTIWETRAGLSSDGPNGAVVPQRILEWMQEAASNASTLGGYPRERYVRMGATWMVHEILLAIDRPIRLGDAIAIETWVSDLRRFRTRREYRIRANGEVAARGQADWLLLQLDPKSGKPRPLRVDEELMAAFPRVPETVIAPEEIPEWTQDPIGPPDLKRDTRKVRPSELDFQAHVNHVQYLTWLEDHARITLGDGLELRTARLAYVEEALPGEEVAIEGWRDGERIQQIVTRNDRPILRALTRRSRFE